MQPKPKPKPELKPEPTMPTSSQKHSRQKAMECIAKIPDPDLRRTCERSLGENATIDMMVHTFHTLYGLPIVHPHQARADFSHISKERLAMRFGLIVEEFIELCRAMDLDAKVIFRYEDVEGEVIETEDVVQALVETEERNIVEVADACADLKYVIVGFELENGIPGHAVLREVHASNLSKLGVDGLPIYRDDGKVMKGPNYFKANVAKVLRAYGIGLGRVFGLNLG